MLGIVLIIVGFVLFHNAWFGLFGKVKSETAGKTLSIVNFMGGAAIVLISAILMFHLSGENAPDHEFFGAMIFLMVGLTYIYIGFDHWFGLDPKAFGVFCLTGAIALFIGGVTTITGAGTIDVWTIWWVLMWFSWAVIWFVLFVECTFEKSFGKLTPVLCLVTTFYTGWIPGILLLTNTGGL